MTQGVFITFAILTICSAIKLLRAAITWQTAINDLNKLADWQLVKHWGVVTGFFLLITIIIHLL